MNDGNPPAEPLARGNAVKRRRAFLLSLRAIAVYSALILLLWWALRNAPLSEIWEVVRKLRLWQILLLLTVDAVIYALISARWWLIVHADHKNVDYVGLVGVRISVFGISYFTLGPQVGGEPLQVIYLRRKHGMTFTSATASVLMDKLLEFLANFVLLAFGCAAVLQAGILPVEGGFPIPILLPLVGLVMWPLIHIILLYYRRYPLATALRVLPAVQQNSRLIRFVRASEHLAGQFCQRHPRALAAAVLASLIASAGTVMEYAFITSFLQLDLPFWQTVSAWTAGWLSFLMPLPGGLGALEASQVFTLGFFGISAASAIGVALLIRGRDLLIGGVGLLLAGRAARRG